MKVTPHYPTLIVCCLVCQQAGDPNPPALARFEQYPDGGATWQLPRCPHGHYRPVRHERLVAEFEHFPAGRNDVRVCL